MFISNSQICNYADYTTSSTRTSSRLNFIGWNLFPIIFINDTSLKIDKTIIKPSKEQKLLGISIYNNLLFKGNVQSICKKASQKLHALSRFFNYMDDRKVEQTMHVFILSQFSYCPLIWMFCDRQMNNRINRIHEKSLRLAYDDYESSFQTFLEKDNSRSMHDKNLQLPLTEIYKTLHNLNPRNLY